ncbi:MAG TPA: hypothetical protein VL132_21610 [Planctomycetaceae bacterium]|nr:hypothetical protein [Planctomycetaceae bacterium]
MNATETHAAYQSDKSMPGLTARESRPWAAWTALVLTLLVAGPLFVCLPLTNDAEYYDLQATNVLQGGVLYRDILEPNLPGVVWLHMLVRTVGGFRSEVLRIADLAIWGAAMALLYSWFKAGGVRPALAAWTVAGCVWCYVSQTEWVHCQRDGWLLPWAIGGVWLRQRQIARMLSDSATARSIAAWAFLEGTIWACGFWIKPYIAIPGFAAWLLAALLVRKPGRVLTDLVGLLVGGGIVGLAGIAWLASTGAWEPFWSTVREWNPLYFQAGREHWRLVRLFGAAFRLAPWSLLVLPAFVPAALWLTAPFRDRDGSPSHAAKRHLHALLAAIWLGWLAQSLWLQHQFDYVYLPVVVLSFVMVALWVGDWPAWPMRMPASMVFLALALIGSPVLRPERLAVWSRCWSEGSSTAVRQRLALVHNPHWEDLRRAEQFLREHGVHDRNVLCYHNSLVYLYRDLELLPPTRYVYLESHLAFFRDRRRSILEEVRAAGADYVVTDLLSTGLPAGQARLPGRHKDDSFPPPFPDAARRQYPWNLPVVFRAGSILIHRAAPAAAGLASNGDQHVTVPTAGQPADPSQGTRR